MNQPTPMSERTVTFRPFPGWSFTVTGRRSDAGVIGEIERSGGLYQRDLAGLLRRLLPADAVVIDAGAHVGVLTLLLSALCPQGHVYAFEPAPETHRHLVANLAANQVANVTPVRAAVHDTDGPLAFSFNETNPGGSSVTSDAAASESVPATRLDTWVAAQGLARLDLVKLDVEGAELAALDGMAATLARFRPVLVVECNPVALRRFGNRSWRDLLARLQAAYPAVGIVGTGGEPQPVRSARQLERELARRGVVDLVARPVVPRAGLRAGLGTVRREAEARLEAHRGRPPVNNFVIEPDVTLQAAGGPLTGRPAEILTVPVGVTNRSSYWLSSAFPHHPVRASYRWADPAGRIVVPNGHRTPFPEPLAPGASTTLPVTVQLPAEPGEYRLRVTLVQEEFAWFDEVDPACTTDVPATVVA